MSITALLFYVTAGLLFAAAFFAVALAVANFQRRLMLAYGVSSFCAGLYQAFSGLYYLNTELAASLVALRWQTASITIGVVGLTATVGLFCRFRHTLALTFVMALWCLVVLVVNFSSESGARFTGDVSLFILELPWGERIYPLRGEPREYFSLLYWGSYLFLFWVVYQALRLVYEQDFIRGGPLVLYILIQLYAAFFGQMIDRGEIEFFYISGFATVILLFLLGVGMAIVVRKSRDELGDVKQGWISSQARAKKLHFDNTMLVEALDKLPIGLQIVDREYRVIKKNDFAVIMGAFNVDVGESLQEVAGFESLPVRKYLQRAFSGNAIESSEVCICTQASSENEQWVRIRFVPLRIDELNIVHTVVMLSEIYSEKYIETNAITQIAAGIAQNAEDGFFDVLVLQLAKLFEAKYAFLAELDRPGVHDKANTLVMVKDGKKVTNREIDLSNSPSVHLERIDLCVLPNALREHFPEDTLFNSLSVESYIAAALKDERGQLVGMLVVMDDDAMHDLERKQALLKIFSTRAVSELLRLKSENKIRRLAYQDDVTGLPNRLQLHVELKRIFNELDFTHCAVFVYLIDLDFFKSINDTLGHELGDAALCALGERLQQSFPHDFYIARFGGDQFFLVHYPKKDSVEILHAKAVDILECIEGPLNVGEHCLSLCASIGCAAIPEHAQNDIDAIRCVELALNKAKASGRSRYEIYDHDQSAISNARFMVRSELRQAMAHGELDLYVQPQLNTQGECVGAEALVRWRHPQRGFVPPDQFIPVAEESGLIHALGDWVIERACQYLAALKTEGYAELDISINISAWQIAHPDFERRLLELTKHYEVNARLLTLEVTESVLMRDVQSTIEIFERLRSFGFRISLDDFGTGFSSLAYLRELPLDELKIDRSFVAALEDTKSSALVSSIIAIARNLELKIVAEGVETRKQRTQLEDLGCDFYQGYLYAKPMPKPEYLEWLKCRD